MVGKLDLSLLFSSNIQHFTRRKTVLKWECCSFAWLSSTQSWKIRVGSSWEYFDSQSKNSQHRSRTCSKESWLSELRALTCKKVASRASHRQQHRDNLLYFNWKINERVNSSLRLFASTTTSSQLETFMAVDNTGAFHIELPVSQPTKPASNEADK